MPAYAWNEWICVSDIFVIMNFADASKKRINPSAKKNGENMGENVFKFLNDKNPKRIGDYCW